MITPLCATHSATQNSWLNSVINEGQPTVLHQFKQLYTRTFN